MSYIQQDGGHEWEWMEETLLEQIQKLLGDSHPQLLNAIQQEREFQAALTDTYRYLKTAD